MIVVGTHEHSLDGSIQERFNHSVAVNLARSQLRPILVIPAHGLRTDTAQEGTAE